MVSRDAALLVGFLNTVHLPDGVDGLAGTGPEQWIADGLSGEGGGLCPSDAGDRSATAPGWRDLRELREGLRALTRSAIARTSAAGTPATTRRLNALLRTHAVVLQWGAELPALIPASGRGAVDRGFADVASALVRCASSGLLARVRTCALVECQWAFYDASKNTSRRWCAMSACGNVVKNRRYRARDGH